MQNDGNLVLYDEAKTVKWSTGTNPHNATYLNMQNDGNLVIYNEFGTSIWATNTFALC